MGFLEDLAELKALVKELDLKGTISSTVHGYVYNEPFLTENLGKDLEVAKENLRKLSK